MMVESDVVCEHLCPCGDFCHHDGCVGDTCLFPHGASEVAESRQEDGGINEMLDELAQQDHEDDVRLVIVHDDIRSLAINMAEVLATYDRIDENDENIFIPRPVIARDAAHNLYNKLISIHECLKAVRKNRQDTE